MKMLYFQTGDGVNDGADEGYAAPVKNFRGFRFIADGPPAGLFLKLGILSVFIFYHIIYRFIVNLVSI